MKRYISWKPPRAAIVGSVVAVCSADIPAPAGIVCFQQSCHCYEVVEKPMTWAAAKSDAESRVFRGAQGHLVTMTNAEENSFVTALLGPNEYYVGATQPPGSPEPGGNWQWVTGEPFTFTNWNTGEPSNGPGDEDSGTIYGYAPVQGFWNDSTGDAVRPYVVEYDLAQCIPAASGWALAALALGVLTMGAFLIRRLRPVSE